jgi:hypothetical protein
MAYISLGMVIWDMGDWDEAVKVSKEAVDRLVNLTKARPGSRNTQHWLAASYGHLGEQGEDGVLRKPHGRGVVDFHADGRAPLRS